MSAAANPVPRPFRRGLDIATAEEWHHAQAHTTVYRADPKTDPDCWFCTHAAAEHLDHDILVPGCPECARDAATSPAVLEGWRAQLAAQSR